VAPLVDEVLQLHRPLAEEKGQTLSGEVDARCRPVDVDRHRLVQALSNLVGNAVKFTPKGGQVRVRAFPSGDSVAVSVTDTGPGIEVEALPHVFDRYWQGRHARRAGAGLGLAIAKGCVEAHGGVLRVESRLGVGSSFTLTVPCSVAKAPSP
jgi:signal transduction histidine kinase